MSLMYVSEAYENNGNILYVRENLSELFFKRETSKITADGRRVCAVFSVEDDLFKVAIEELADKVADVIAVGYKYMFFSEKLRMQGLKAVHRELLLAALISADIEEDKRYVRSRFSCRGECAIDGFFNFRLSALKRKWNEIVGYIPDYFSENELREFIIYLIGEKRGKRVLIDGGRVYDRRYNRLRRASLIPRGDELPVTKEVLLSGAGEIELKGRLPEEDEAYLKDYFGDKISFKQL